MNMKPIAAARGELAGRECRQALMQEVNAAIASGATAAATQKISGELERSGCQVEAAIVAELLEGETFADAQLERNAAEIRRLRTIVDQHNERNE